MYHSIVHKCGGVVLLWRYTQHSLSHSPHHHFTSHYTADECKHLVPVTFTSQLCIRQRKQYLLPLYSIKGILNIDADSSLEQAHGFPVYRQVPP